MRVQKGPAQIAFHDPFKATLPLFGVAQPIMSSSIIEVLSPGTVLIYVR